MLRPRIYVEGDSTPISRLPPSAAFYRRPFPHTPAYTPPSSLLEPHRIPSRALPPSHPPSLMPVVGLGATNVCSLESASPDDALLSSLSDAMAGGRSGGGGGLHPPALRLVLFTTRLLTDAHPHIIKAVMVGKGKGG